MLLKKLDELDALRRLFNNDSKKYDELKARYERFQSQSFKTLNMILIAYQPVVNLLLKTVKSTRRSFTFTRFTNNNDRLIPSKQEYVNTVQTGK